MIFAVSFIYGQQSTGVVNGTILDEKNQPLDYANVLLLNASDSTLVKGSLTDSSGTFQFTNLSFKDYIVQASMVGYGDVYSPVFHLSESQANHQMGNLSFSKSNVDLDEVVVKAKKPFIEMRADKMVVNVEGNAVAAGDNALEVLRKAPGVIVDQNNNISLQGKQGVLVMINGKRSYLSAEQVARMLENMSANEIQNIELITNPSAKYDAEGNAGIINIVMKKNKNHGFNGQATANVRQATYFGYAGGLNLNYRNKHINLHGGYDYNLFRRYKIMDLRRSIAHEGDYTEMNQFSTNRGRSSNHSYKAGLDWMISDKTSAGVMFKGSTGRWSDLGNYNLYFTGDLPGDFSHVNTLDDTSDEWEDFSYNINFKHSFDDKGKELTADVDYSTFHNPANAFYENMFYNNENVEVTDPYLLRSEIASDVSIKAAKVDYAQPIGETIKLETGLKSSFVSTDNGILFEEFEGEEWIKDEGRTNMFTYDENIFAAYANVSKKFEKFSLQAGLRSEYTQSEGYSETLDERRKTDYINFFPSVSLSHTIKEKHNMSYSYSRRIRRPSYQDLNPFLYYLDQYTFSKGNPFLQPQFTHSLGVNYSYGQFLYVSAGYDHTSDRIMEILEQDDANKITNQTTINADLEQTFELSVSSPIPIKEWWMVRLTTFGGYNHFKTDLPNGDLLNNASFMGYFQAVNNFNINKKIQAELSGSYQTGLTWGMFQLKPQTRVDAGVNMKVLDGKGQLKLSVNDIFFTGGNNVEIEEGSIQVRLINRWDSRRVKLGFTYNFGNQDMKPTRRRKSATSDEQNRVKRNSN